MTDSRPPPPLPAPRLAPAQAAPGLTEAVRPGRRIAASARRGPVTADRTCGSCGTPLGRAAGARRPGSFAERPAPVGAMACTAVQLRGRVVSRNAVRAGAYMRAFMVPRVPAALLACDRASVTAAVSTSSSATARSTMPAATASAPP